MKADIPFMVVTLKSVSRLRKRVTLTIEYQKYDGDKLTVKKEDFHLRLCDQFTYNITSDILEMIKKRTETKP